MIKWRRVAGFVLGVALLGSASVALAQDTSPNIPSDVTELRELNLELVGQVQNSAPGVSPAPSIHDAGC